MWLAGLDIVPPQVGLFLSQEEEGEGDSGNGEARVEWMTWMTARKRCLGSALTVLCTLPGVDVGG